MHPMSKRSEGTGFRNLLNLVNEGEAKLIGHACYKTVRISGKWTPNWNCEVPSNSLDIHRYYIKPFLIYNNRKYFKFTNAQKKFVFCRVIFSKKSIFGVLVHSEFWAPLVYVIKIILYLLWIYSHIPNSHIPNSHIPNSHIPNLHLKSCTYNIYLQ